MELQEGGGRGRKGEEGEGRGEEEEGGKGRERCITRHKEARGGGMDKGLLIPAKRPLLDLLIITSFRHAYKSNHRVRPLPYFSDGRH